MEPVIENKPLMQHIFYEPAKGYGCPFIDSLADYFAGIFSDRNHVLVWYLSRQGGGGKAAAGAVVRRSSETNTSRLRSASSPRAPTSSSNAAAA